MDNIIHEKNYIHRQKVISLTITMLSAIAMIAFYIIYRHIDNIYIIILSAVCAIPIAQSFTRYILLFPHRDCDTKISDSLHSISDKCYIINSALFTDGNENRFVDNIIICGKNVICIVDNSKKYSLNAVDVLKNILISKRIEFNLNIIYRHDYSLDNLKKYMIDLDTNGYEIFIAIKSHLI